MLGKSVDASELLARKKRAILVASQRSKGTYVQLENKQMGFTNGLLSILGTRGLDTYLPVPPRFVPPVCIGTYLKTTSIFNTGNLTITSSSYSFEGPTIPTLSVPPISIYNGLNLTLPGVPANFVFVIVNCSGRSVTLSVSGSLPGTIENGYYLYGAVTSNNAPITFIAV
jgi:hypothetical protein